MEFVKEQSSLLDALVYMHVDKGMSLTEISGEIGKSRSWIWGILSEVGVMRPPSMANHWILLMDLPIGSVDKNQTLIEKNANYQLWRNVNGGFGVVEIRNNKYFILARMGTSEDVARECFMTGKTAREVDASSGFVEKVHQMYLAGKSIGRVSFETGRSLYSIYWMIHESNIMRSLSESMSIAMKGKIVSPETRIKLSGPRSKEFGETCHRAAIKRWCDINYIKSQIAARNTHPNGEEIDCFHLLQEVCPGKFEMNVNGEVQEKYDLCLSGIPDFIWVERRKIILYNGCYYHACIKCGKADVILPGGVTGREKHQHDAHRIAKLRSSGWQVLIVWTHDLYGDRKELISMIEDFITQ